MKQKQKEEAKRKKAEEKVSCLYWFWVWYHFDGLDEYGNKKAIRMADLKAKRL